MLVQALAQVANLDGALSEEVTDLRWHPLTSVMDVASSWWVKGPLFVAAAVVVDLLLLRRAGGRRVPCAALLTLAAVLLGSLLSTLAKLAIDRPRPPLGDAGISALGALPSTSSFPSGHATTAFAAAAALAWLRPSLRVWAFGLAALVAVSRVYLGMHYAGDVLAGAALGTAIGALLAMAGRRVQIGVS
jgi:undecaprenyl-diphosphatase